MKNREKIIQNYIEGYNEFDVDKMVEDFDAPIVFENISNGEPSVSLTGLDLFKEQAEQVKNYFSTRMQTIKSYTHRGDETEVEIDYKAVLATDFPNGLKRGDKLNLQGKSIFQFSRDKIIKLTDIS